MEFVTEKIEHPLKRIATGWRIKFDYGMWIVYNVDSNVDDCEYPTWNRDNALAYYKKRVLSNT